MEDPRVEDPRATTAPARPRARWKTWFLVLVVPVSLLLFEVSFRVWIGSRSSSAARLATRLHEIADEIDRSSGAFGGTDEAEGDAPGDVSVAHPYFGWYGTLRESKIPGTVHRSRASPDDYEVLIVGGSVAGQIAASGGEDIVEVLQSDSRLQGREVRLVTHARGGFKQPQQLNLVTYLLGSGWTPDAVINIDGFNEVAIGYQNAVDFDVHPNHPAFFLWGPVATADTIDREAVDLLLDMRSEQRHARELADRFESYGLSNSAVLSFVCLERMRATRQRFYDARNTQLEWVKTHGREKISAGPPFDAELDRVLELSVRNWAESSLSLHALCAARSIHYVHVLQPTLYDEGSKPLTARERADATAPDSWIAGARAGYPLLRAEGERLRSKGVHFIDATPFFDTQKERRYKDSCHFIPAGCYELGNFVGNAFVESLPAD
jgi:hypothetical protein